MYYQNGNYMQDLNYYNQNPNLNLNYNYNQIPNSYQNMNINNQMTNMPQNLSTFYPAVYRIIQPISSQVVSNNNTSYLTEDLLNNMVESVYNIVEGDINMNNNSNISTENSRDTDNSTNCSRAQTTSSSNSSRANSSSNVGNSQNALLKDLIKIMILNDIIARRNVNQLNIQNGMNNMNQSMYM